MSPIARGIKLERTRVRQVLKCTKLCDFGFWKDSTEI